MPYETGDIERTIRVGLNGLALTMWLLPNGCSRNTSFAPAFIPRWQDADRMSPTASGKPGN
jgi:hypothetical protein